MERGWIHALPQSHSVEEKEHDVFISFSFPFGGEFVCHTKCVNWATHTLSIPYIGENCMCEVSNSSMHCFYQNETNNTGNTTRLIYIAHIMRDFAHFDCQTRTC